MKKKPITIHLKADTSELDEVQEKLDELHIALTRANILMDELANKNIEIRLGTKVSEWPDEK